MIIKSPFVTEKVAGMIDENNTMEFLVDLRANKADIKKEIEDLFDLEIASVRTMITPKGNKKAVVTFIGEKSANELATRLNLL